MLQYIVSMWCICDHYAVIYCVVYVPLIYNIMSVITMPLWLVREMNYCSRRQSLSAATRPAWREDRRIMIRWVNGCREGGRRERERSVCEKERERVRRALMIKDSTHSG